MADKKISQLTSATTPLAGTEELPLVQSGVTKKVSVDNFTAGRNVSVGATVGVPRTLNVGGSVAIDRYGASPHVAMRGGDDSTVGYEYRLNLLQTQGLAISTATIGGSQNQYWFFQPNGDFQLSSSNLVIGTAAKGIDFSANTGAAGETSSLLDWYEEGTFTPTSLGSTSAGTGTYTTQTGVYTRIGRIVHAFINVAWTAHTGTGNLRIDGLPFSAANNEVASLFVNGLTYTGTRIQAFTVGTQIWLSETSSGAADTYLAMDTSCQIILSVSYYVA